MLVNKNEKDEHKKLPRFCDDKTDISFYDEGELAIIECIQNLLAR